MKVAGIFSDGNAFVLVPHNYAVSALQIYYDRPIRGPYGDDSLYGGFLHDNFKFSPVYRLGNLFARIGNPTPPWFRLSGVVFLALIFILVWYGVRGADKPIDRILATVVVVTTPCLYFCGGLIDDHPVHLFLIVLALTIAVRTGGRFDKNYSKLFFFIPALDLLTTHMLTNSLLTLLTFYSLYLGTFFERKSLSGGARVAAEEKVYLLAGLFLIPVVFRLRMTDAGMTIKSVSGVLNYYLSETSAHRVADASFLSQILTYPEKIFFSVCGVYVSLAAMLNFSAGYRSRFIRIYLPSFVIPLLILSFIGKKQTDYIWFVAPSLAFAAADSLTVFSRKTKSFLIVFLLLLGPGDFQFSFFSKNALYMDIDFGISKEAEMRVRSEAVLDGISMCGDLEERVVHIFNQTNSESSILRFMLLSNERRPYYQNAPLPMQDETDILKDAEKKIFVHFSGTPMFYPSDEHYFQVLKKMTSPVYSTKEFEIYCLSSGVSRSEPVTS